MTTIQVVMSPTTYSIEVAAVNSVDTGPYREAVMIETPLSKWNINLLTPILFDVYSSQSYIMFFSGVYLSLNGDFIPNHGYVMISDIGSTDNTALLCITNKAAPNGSSDSGGDWFAPDGDTVGSSIVPGFDRNRAAMIVRLRSNDGTPEEGIYHCVVEDADNIPQRVYVGLYNSGGGNGKAII